MRWIPDARFCMILFFALGAVGATFGAPARAGVINESAKLVAADGAAGDLFGISVAVSGDVALVGAPGDSSGGAAFVFRFDGSTWNEEARLLPSSGDPNLEFGHAVSIEGNVAVVGAPGGSSASVFRFDGSAWSEEQVLVPADGGWQFGNSVGLSGDRAVIGAPLDDDPGLASGVVFLFARTDTGWVETDKLLASDGQTGDYFGFDVDLAAGVTISGAYFEDQSGVDAGAAYVFEDLCDPALGEPAPGNVGVVNTLTATCGTVGAPVFFLFGFSEGTTPVPGCPGVNVGIANPRILGSAVADADGVSMLSLFVPNAAAGMTVILQAVGPSTCRVSNLLRYAFPL